MSTATPANYTATTEPPAVRVPPPATGSEEFVPFGPDWENFTLRLPKKHLVEMIRKQGMLLDSIREETIEPLRRNLGHEYSRRVLAEAAVTACHSAMLGKVNPKHPAWGCVYAVQDVAIKASPQNGRDEPRGANHH